MAKKCTDCLLCLDTVYFLPRRFFHCWLCGKYYDIIDGVLTVVVPEDELKKHLDLLIAQEEQRLNEEKRVGLRTSQEEETGKEQSPESET